MKDPDVNRIAQELIAQRARLNGFRHAQRYIEVGACEWCVDHALEIIDIGLVISGKADHHNGKCKYRFLP
jgi:hypothetical protein